MSAAPERPWGGPGQILPFAAARYPDKTALITSTSWMSYRELDRLSDAVAASLAARGVVPGDVCSVYGQNCWEWIVAYHGILKAGAVVNPVNVMLTGPELTFVLTDCRAKVLFVGPGQLPTALAAAADAPALDLVCVLGEGDPGAEAVPLTHLLAAGEGQQVPLSPLVPQALCSIGYTSGTTGHPKGAMQSHRSILLNCALTATMHGRTAEDVVVTALPAAHVYGNVAINSTFLVGGTVVLMDRFDPARTLELIASEHATMFEGVPAMYSMMTAHADFAHADLSSLRMSSIGGQTFAPELIDRWNTRAPGPVLELWGMTELSGLGTTHAVHAPPVPGSIGVCLPGLDLRIAALDDTGAEAVPGEHGELLVRGPLVMLGYLGRPEATAEALSPDGWLRTGDIAYRDDTGHVFIVDRLKDMILTGGYNVYPAEIERVVATHPAVAMVAVGAVADPVKGEIAVAYVVPVDGARPTASEVIEYCRDQLAAYKRPREVVFVDSLPTTSSGKLMRRLLAETYPLPERTVRGG
ncbi:class I adenylate-forming enzyme family protein [Nocardia jiangxiensis]|uniref:class I adenylate-forming enzyme family protein n=1 Tax=Nocardia jiangxiensis TaxID=282685 RepID=UPI0002EC734A|nr:AMP-binding protein [Nocardia jiangxiensis]